MVSAFKAKKVRNEFQITDFIGDSKEYATIHAFSRKMGLKVIEESKEEEDHQA